MSVQSATANGLLQLGPNDNIGVATRTLESGDQVQLGGKTLEIPVQVMLGHKVAHSSIPSGDPVYKYGQIIGFATCDIQPGDWVHSHNLAAGNFEREYSFATEVPPDPAPITDRTFEDIAAPTVKRPRATMWP